MFPRRSHDTRAAPKVRPPAAATRANSRALLEVKLGSKPATRARGETRRTCRYHSEPTRIARLADSHRDSAQSCRRSPLRMGVLSSNRRSHGGNKTLESFAATVAIIGAIPTVLPQQHISTRRGSTRSCSARRCRSGSAACPPGCRQPERRARRLRCWQFRAAARGRRDAASTERRCRRRLQAVRSRPRPRVPADA